MLALALRNCPNRNFDISKNSFVLSVESESCQNSTHQFPKHSSATKAYH